MSLLSSSLASAHWLSQALTGSHWPSGEHSLSSFAPQTLKESSSLAMPARSASLRRRGRKIDLRPLVNCRRLGEGDWERQRW